MINERMQEAPPIATAAVEHWETLKDPDLPDAFVLHAPMVRKNLKPQTTHAQVRPSGVIHLLLIVARPRGGRDVGYRTISRPLVETLRMPVASLMNKLPAPSTATPVGLFRCALVAGMPSMGSA